MKKLSRLLLVLTLVLLIGCTSVLLVACDDGTDQGPAPTTPSFRVSFMKNYPESGEEDVAFTNVTVRQGRTVSAYEITEDDRPAGYDFVGWFVEKDGDEKFDFATKITQNVKIYAHWTENGKSTEADLKGGVFTPEKVKIKTKEGEKEVDNGVWRYVTGANNEIAHEESRFDFDTDVLRKLKAASPKTTYSVWKDEECSLTINNDATNLVVNLKNGDNVYYIKAVAEDSKVTAVYKINVYLEPKYDVSVIRIQGNYESGVTISDVAKGQKATAPSIATYVGHTFDGWYYYSEEKRNDKGQIVDADEDSGNILVKVGDKYYLADENGNRRFAYVDENGKKVVLYKGKYYLTDKSGARLADEATEIYNRLDENGLPVYDEGKPIKVGSKTEYKWDFNVNVIDREDITVFGKWTTNTYSITLKISEADKANGAKFAKTNETELFIGGVNFGATDKAIAQLISNKIGETTDSSRPVEKPFATFAGWYYTDDLGNEIKVVDENGNGVHAFDFAKDIDLVANLVAKFNAVTYKLVVNANDDSMMQEVTGSNDAWPYDQKATFTANPKDGYTLVRWLLNGEEYAPFGANKSVEYNIDEKHVINKTITFTAVFAPKDINVTLVDTVDNYGKTFVVKYNSDVALGQDAIPDVPKLSNDGTKRFIGWYYLDSEGTKTYVVKYNVNKNEILVGKWAFTEDVTLTAEWQPYEFHIAIYKAKSKIAMPDADMGTVNIDTGWDAWMKLTGSTEEYDLEGYTKPFDNNAEFRVTASVSDNNYYVFKCWKRLTADGQLVNVEEGEVENNQLKVKVQEQDVAYVAILDYKPVTVTFDRGGAPESVVVPENVNVDFNKPLALKVPEGAPTEETFAGWWYGEVQYTGADGTSVDYKTITDPEFIKNGIKLTAKWVPIEYFVIENGVIVGIDENKAKKGDSYKTEFTINFDDAVHAIKDGAFKNNKFIRKITIKGNIQTIGEEAFANSNIAEVVFEGNFKGLAIGAGAFRNCVRITAITLPDNVEQIGDNVFEGCYNLTNLAYSAEIPLGRLFTTVNPQNDNWYEAKQGDVTYYLPKKLKEIVVTNTATAIADFAFQNASQLTKVTLAIQNGDKPYTTKIGNYAFANTGSIEVNLGSVEIIGNAAFRNSGIATIDNNGVATVELIALKKLGVDAFNGTTRITFVDFSKASIDNVSARAFANSSIASVNLGRIKTISMSAFANSKLSVISDSESVETIMEKAFFNATAIKANIINNNFINVVDIGKEAFLGTDFFNTASGLVVIGKVLYSAKSEGGTIAPKPNVVSIAPYAFEKSQFVTLDLSGFSSLKYIESYAFAGNGKIVEVTLPASLSEIKDNAFKGSSIKKINLSACSNISRIWQYAFANCEALDTITFATFTSTNDMAVKLAINDYAFSGCIALKTLNLPENLGTLDSYAFKGCTALTTVNFVANAKFITPETTEGGTDPAPEAYDPAGLVTTIGDGAFMDCTSLTTITLPYFIARIGNSAFENCTALATFTTMDGADKKTAALRTIGDRAFFGNTSLNNVDVNTTKGVNTIGVSAFENCGQLATINLSGVTRFAEGVFRNAKALKSVTMSASASIYVGQEAFRNCVTLSDITARIAAVEDGAFRNCISLRAITFVSSGIEYIGSNAFNGCVLIQKVSIPSSVVAIGDSAFDGCRGITSLTFESNETLQTIGYSAFGGCSLLTKVILPSSLVELNASAFYGCSDLKYVEFGENIQTVGEDAFALCATGIEVRFTGKTVPVFTGDIFTLIEKEVEGKTVLVADGTIRVRQGYRTTFEAVLGTKYTIVEYTA